MKVIAMAVIIAAVQASADAAAGPAAGFLQGRAGAGSADARAPLPDPRGTGAAAVALNEGFEQTNVLGGGIFANGWIRQNHSDDPNSYWWPCLPISQDGVWNAADGPDGSCLLSSYESTLIDGGTISNWIVTPLVSFGSGSTVSFYTRTKPGSQYPDRLQVRACTSGACTDFGTGSEDVGDFTTVLFDINPGEVQGGFPEDWTQYTLDFSAGVPQSGSGRIAFRHYVHDGGDGGTHGNLIGLDRVVVASAQEAQGPLSLAVTVAPADAAHPDACGTATSLDATTGDQVNVCYTVTNGTTDTLNYHYLRDDIGGTILSQLPQTVAPGATYRYNRVVTVGQTQAPSSTWTAQAGPWGYTYTVAPPPGQIVDISDGVPLGGGQYPPAMPFPSDFDFRFYGQPIQYYCVANEGLFEVLPAGTGCNANLLYSTLPNINFVFSPEIVPFWINTQSVDSGTMYSQVVGTAPNRQFIVEWKDVETLFDGPVTMEAVLNEGSGVIEFRYAADYGNSSQPYATGLQNQYQANVYPSSGNLAGVGSIVWTPADPTAYTATRKATINALAPTLALDPAAIAASAPSHGSAIRSVAIDNGGAGRLDWSIATASVPGNMPVVPRFVLPMNAAKDVSFGRRPSAAPPAGGTSPKAPALPFGDASRYAYAVDLLEGPYLWQFDPDDVNGANIVGYIDAASLMTGATFVDDDFTKLYVFDAANDRLAWLDLSSQFAQTHVVGTAPQIPIDTATGMKQDPSSGVVYLSSADGQSSSLWTIDPATAAVTLVGSTIDAPGIIDIAFDEQGNLYGVDIVLGALVAIAKDTGDAQPIGSLGFAANFASGLAFDFASHLLYFSSIDATSMTAGLWTIDLGSGAATLVSPLTPIDGIGSIQWDALAIAHPAANDCTDPASVPWLAPKPANGSIAAGGAEANVSLAFDASSLADGTYSANLCVYSNDPMSRHRSIPVTFTVGAAADAIFADGFDGPAP